MPVVSLFIWESTFGSSAIHESIAWYGRSDVLPCSIALRGAHHINSGVMFKTCLCWQTYCWYKWLICIRSTYGKSSHLLDAVLPDSNGCQPARVIVGPTIEGADNVPEKTLLKGHQYSVSAALQSRYYCYHHMKSDHNIWDAQINILMKPQIIPPTVASWSACQQIYLWHIP